MNSGGNNMSYRNYSLGLLCAGLLVLPLSLRAQTPPTEAIDLSQFEDGGLMGLNMEVLEDKTGERTIQNLPAGDWRKSTEKAPGYGFAPSAYWVRFRVKNPTATHLDWMLEINYPHLDQIQFFVPGSAGAYETRRSGDYEPFNAREVQYRNFIFILKERPYSENTYYMRVATTSVINLPLVKWTPAALTSKISNEQMALGLYYGSMLVMLFYNLFLFVSLRSRTYLYYILYILAFVLFQAMYNGLAFQYVYPTASWLNFLIPFSIALFSLAIILFSRRFLDTATTTRYLDKVLFVLAVLNALLLPVSLVLSYSAAARIIIPVAALGFLFLLIVGTIRLLRGSRAARFYMIGWSFLLSGLILSGLNTFGVLPPNFLTIYGMQIGSVLEVVLLSLGLADRINTMKMETQRAQAEALANREEALENLKKADRLKDEFLANTSHELRTPLNGIIGIAESLMDGAAGDLNETARRNLSMIAVSGRRLSSLVNDILDFSSMKNKELILQARPVDLKELVSVILTLSQPLVGKKNITLKNEIPDGLPPVFADENRLQQIMHNLVGNAVKFTESGEVSVRARLENGVVAVSVLDTGIGIPAGKLQDIFKSFEQVDASISREYGGTGLGLTITKQLIELHGGTVNVRSEVGTGSEFTITLPISEQGLEAGQEAVLGELRDDFQATPGQSVIDTPAPANAPGPNGIYNILVVDDETINIQVLRNQLSLNNFQVSQAQNGEEALAKIAVDRPDLVLLDIMMPRMSGFEVAKKLRESFSESELPILMLTAKNQVGDLVTGFDSGANDYLTKPFSRRELMSRIRTHLRLSKINWAYSRFVPREFLQHLGKESIIDLKLGDQVQREMTVLFSDIRSFTELSEAMSPKDTFDFLNGYLRRVGPVVRKNGGFIDKYIGDAVMALFPRSPEDALRAAIEMNKKLALFNSRRERAGLGRIAVGIGVNTGSLMLGTIGERERMETTVISDAVNLASRVEGLTKVYGAPVIITEKTLLRLENPERYGYRMLDRVNVKGKKETVSVYEIFDADPRESAELKRKSRADFEKAINYFLSDDFDAAFHIFKAILQAHPGDVAAAMYLRRCRENAGLSA